MIGLILSTYNGERYIAEQLESLKNQTKKIDHVLIKDDCSSDKTIEIVNHFIQKYNLDWTVMVNDVNLGWKKNFLSGLNFLNDDYIFFCDQDDVWRNDKVEKTIDVFLKTDALVVCTNYELFYSSNEASKVLEKENKKQNNNGRVVKVKLNKRNFYIRRPGCSMCVSRKIILQNKALLDLDYPHDALFWKTALLHNKLYLLNLPLLMWRRHESNASTPLKRDKNRRLNGILQEMCFAKLLYKINKSRFTFDFYNFANLRYEFSTSGSILKWFKLYKYRKFYVSFKSYLGDYLILKKIKIEV